MQLPFLQLQALTDEIGQLGRRRQAVQLRLGELQKLTHGFVGGSIQQAFPQLGEEFPAEIEVAPGHPAVDGHEQAGGAGMVLPQAAQLLPDLLPAAGQGLVIEGQVHAAGRGAGGDILVDGGGKLGLQL